VVFPAFASAMLLATTTQLTQDVAVVPFLWVLPLAVYLVSFIVAFDKPEWVRAEILAPVTVLLSFAAALLYYLQPRGTIGILSGIGASVAVLFAIGLLCHGATAALKPEARRLTGYYLCVSGGGALGGLFAGVVAPGIFSTLFEWKLGLGIATLAAGAGTVWAWRGFLRAHLNIAAALLVLVGVGFAFQSALLASHGRRLETSRNFYGVISVERSVRRDASEADMIDLIHGRVLHGRQFVDERHRRTPVSYYTEKSGLGRVMEFYRSRPDLRVGGVGLGAGTIAAYGLHPTQAFRFYEINPEMERIARTHFTYLRDCPGKVEVVLGDGRLSLEREEPQGFHVLALDAFAGHSVPVHLLTAEAMTSYARHLAPDGALAVHASNYLLDLAPVVRGAARANGLSVVRIDHRPGEKEAGTPSVWMICTRNEALIRALRADASTAEERAEVTWTDDASDLFSILKRR
jgi:spermidine synthase